MIVRLEADGAVVADADDCSAVHVQTTLDPNGLRAALLHTGTGSVLADGAGEVVLDVAVLRSRAALVASVPDWAQRFDELIASSGERLTDDGLGLRVPVEPPLSRGASSRAPRGS
jgi:hypothetical protein